MERVLRTIEVDGHTVEVVEMVDDEREWIVLVVDEVVINEDSPLPTDADEDDIRAAVHSWIQRA